MFSRNLTRYWRFGKGHNRPQAVAFLLFHEAHVFFMKKEVFKICDLKPLHTRNQHIKDCGTPTALIAQKEWSVAMNRMLKEFQAVFV